MDGGGRELDSEKLHHFPKVTYSDIKIPSPIL